MSIRANSRFLLKIRAWLQTWIRCLALAYVEHINFHQTFLNFDYFLLMLQVFSVHVVQNEERIQMRSEQSVYCLDQHTKSGER